MKSPGMSIYRGGRWTHKLPMRRSACLRTPLSLGRRLFARSRAGLLQVVLTESVRTSISRLLQHQEENITSVRFCWVSVAGRH